MLSNLRKTAVVGSRTWNNYQFLKEKLLEHKVEFIISGGAAGADEQSRLFAKEFGLSILIFYPDWNKYGSQAGFIRNKLIVENCDELICFRINMSKGCSHSVELAKKMNKKIWVYDF